MRPVTLRERSRPGFRKRRVASRVVSWSATRHAPLHRQPSGQNQAVDVFFGTQGAPGAGKYTNGQLPPNAVWQVQLQPGDGKQHVIIGSRGNVMAQLAVDDGTKVDVAMLVPC
jgi:hypothetical protein